MHADYNHHIHRKKIRRKNSISAAILLLGLGGIALSLFLYPQVFASSAFWDGKKELSLEESVVIKFSDTMIPQTFEGRVDIYPKEELKFRWQNFNRELVILPAKGWKPETEYHLSMNGVRNMMLVKRSFYFTFRTIGYPEVASFYPENGAQNVALDIEDPIALKFQSSIDDFRIKIAVDPVIELEKRVDLEKNLVHLIPKNGLERGKKYSFQVSVKGNNESDENYRSVFGSAFTTKPEAPKVWEKDFALRIEQAKLHTEPQITEGKYIDINVKSQVMAIFENGRVLDAYLISSGKRGMDTPQGSFKIANKYPRPWSKKYSLFMPFWMAITSNGDYGIHELPEWPGGYKEGANHLGIPVSHGCVRLGIGPAERVYNWAEIGTPVVVHS